MPVERYSKSNPGESSPPFLSPLPFLGIAYSYLFPPRNSALLSWLSQLFLVLSYACTLCTVQYKAMI